jgi:release factor glutamine methyltransferase
MPHRIGALFKKIRKQLRPVSGDLSDREAEIILEDVLDLSRSTLLSRFNSLVNSTQFELINTITKKRLSGIPLAHALGSAYFHSKKFTVSRDVLIPRPDTEILIEVVLQNESSEFCRFIDIGTGSGNIAETLCTSMPKWQTIAVDISEPSLQIAKTNCSKQVNLVCSDKLSAIKSCITFDFIVCNPPYISKREMGKLESSVSEYEPAIALYGGEDGLDFYRYLAKHTKNFLKVGGYIYCEIGFTQGETCTTIFKNAGWKNMSISSDLANRPRIIKAHK